MGRNGKPVVLCVDDEQFNREVLKDILEPEGYAVLEASETAEARTILENNPVDLILLDINMPGETGYEMCSKLKAQDRYRNIPVILLTALHTTEDRIKGIEAGAEDFITKPFHKEEILARIRMLLKVKGLNEKLVYAYNTIKSITAFGDSFIQTFRPQDFDLLFSMDGIVSQLFREDESPFVKPSLIILHVHDQESRFYVYSMRDGRVNREPLHLANQDGSPFQLELPGPGTHYLNEHEVKGSQLSTFLSQLEREGVPVRNTVSYVSHDLSLFALNYLSDVTPYDAAVLESLVMQAHFLRSLSTQVAETEDAFNYTVFSLARAAEANDEDTGDHIMRVGEYCALIVERMGMSDRFGRAIKVQAALHDIGKIHTPADILKKPGKLTDIEWEEIKRHTIYGGRIIGEHPRFTMGRNIALTHHERWDGSGYPNGLAGETIPLEGRVVAVADTYDALRNVRVYKDAIGHDEACRIILEGDERTMPHHFCPEVFNAFKGATEKFGEIFETMQD
jgi:response regulator RpfG family c-di-GMP phosphodiesterase